MQSLKKYIHILWSGVPPLRSPSKEIILHFHKENSTLYNKALTWDSLNVYQLGTGSKSCSVQYGSVTQSCLTLCDPMDCSTPGLPVHHQLPEFTQTHVHWVSDAIQPPHPLLSPSPPTFNLSQHQGLFKWISSSHQVAKYWSFSIVPSSEYSGLISFKMDWLDLLTVQSPYRQESDPTPQFKSINSSALSFLYSPTLTSIHDYWKIQSFD